LKRWLISCLRNGGGKVSGWMEEHRSHRGPAALVIAMTLLLLLLAPLSGRHAATASAQQNIRLASLQIEVWPEFDSPAALVILRAELAPDVTLPAAMSLRIPASSGGPAAVASADSPDAELLNMPFDRANAADAITLTFTAQHRFLHLEFYDPIETGAPERSYTYTWPGDLSVDRLSVRVQEPASATGLSTQPELASGIAGSDGISYRSADLGAFDAGKTLPVTISYRKTDTRTSTEILGLTPAGAQTTVTKTGDGVSLWLLLPAVAAGLIAGGVLATAWHRRLVAATIPSRAERRRRRDAGERENAAGFCPQCGNRLEAENRFCPRCGAAARSR
jgi:hypothetical protein